MYSKPEYTTLRSTIGTITKEGGVLSLWNGLLPRMTRIIGECRGAGSTWSDRSCMSHFLLRSWMHLTWSCPLLLRSCHIHPQLRAHNLHGPSRR